jgi:hypothetical protein
VADHHTYFVGSKAWGFALWAHNRCGGPPPPEFTADRPFHFLIRDNATSATLFMGRVSDPLLEEAPTTLVPRVDGAQARPGDADGDDDVDFADFLVLAENFGRDDDPTSADGDFNGDHVVDFADFLILQQNFDQPPPISSPAAAPDKETAWLESARYSDLVMLDQNLLELDSPTSLQRAI